MTRERTALRRLAPVGALCGFGAAVVHLLALRLLVYPQLNGLPHLAGLSLAVPGGHGSALVGALRGLTWFDLPAECLYLLAPLALLGAGVVAGRLTYSTRPRVGLRAGAPLALGFTPPMLLLGGWLGMHTGGPHVLLGLFVVPVLYPLAFGPLGGVVGVKT